MISQATRTDWSPATLASPAARVRDHLKMRFARRGTHTDPPRADLKGLLARLARLHRRGGDYQRIELSSHVTEAVKSLQLVSNELLVLAPERQGA